jgi:apolipoprotein D and lipocalin family protein
MKFALACLLFLSACSTARPHLPPQPTVAKVDLKRFMGKWYVIASIPTRFEKGAVNATETYTWNEKENRVDIDFRYRQDSPSGEEKNIPQKGFIHNQETKAEWRVQPLWPFQFAYLIVDLADDYSDTIVGVPDRDLVWIMARKPEMSDSRYMALESKLGRLGYELSKLKKVPQVWQ